MDLDSFLYGVVYCVGWEGEREGDSIPPLTPSLAPVVTSTVQEAWWSVASKAVSGSLQPADRRTLQHGVEAIRCTGLHGLDINLTMKLGKTFESLSLESAVASEEDQGAGEIVSLLEERAGIYYRASLVSVERMEKGGGLREPSVRLLQAAGNTPGQGEMDKMKEAAHFFLACQKMHQGNSLEAIAAFRELRSPYASFYTGEIYKKMALQERADAGLGDDGEGVRELLVECREALYLTLDRLRGAGGGHHPLDSQLAEQIEEVENMLVGSSNGTEPELAPSLPTPVGTPKRSAPSISRLASQLTSTPQTNRSLFDSNTSLGRVEARPSPERLDAQMRQLTGELSRTTSQLARTVSQVGEGADMAKVVEATKEVVESSNKVLGEIRDNLLPAIKDVFHEVKEIRRDSRDRDEKILEILTKISENTAAAASNPVGRSSELSEEERLLLDSFGYTGQFQAASAGNIYPFLQQQMLQQQLARQTPNMMAATMGYNMSSLYGNMFNPLAAVTDVMNPNTNTVTQQLPQLIPSAAIQPQMPVVVPTPQLPTIPQPQQVVMPQMSSVSSPAPISTIQLPTITSATSKPFSSAPSNVVISVSDPIPLTAPPITTPMTVTVPLQHRLGGLTNTPRTSSITPTTPQSAYKTPAGTPTNPATPHSYQIKMPAGASPLTTSPFKTGDDPAVTITTQSLLSTIPNPIFSAVTPSPEKPHVTSSHKTRMASGSTPARINSEGVAGDEPEEYEPQVDFAPVIPLPEVVVVVTGEEDEQVMFEDRAKLFRFSDETKEWKERGLGQAKILKDKGTGKVRFLMRREQTFKVCANHQLTSNMKLDKMNANKKARIWGAQDFADEELKTEKFCIRFKTEEQADNFEQKFLEAAEASKDAVSPVKETKKESSPNPGGTTLAQFAAAQKQSSWECGGCLTRNDNSKIQCLACEGPKPGCEEEVEKLKEAVKPAAPIMTIGASGGFKFGGAAPASSTGSGFNLSSSTSATASGFSFGTPSTTSVSASGFSFGTQTATSTVATTSAASTGFSFGTPKSSAGTSTSESKQSVGGFSFNSTPVLKPVEVKKDENIEEKKIEAAPKPSPFSGFSFGGGSSSATPAFGAATGSVTPAFGSGSTLAFGSKTESIVTDEKDSSEAAPLFGSKTDQSFSTVAGGEGFKSDPNFKGFAGSGSSVFGSQKKEGVEEGGADEEYEPDVHFQPVIPLPELVEVKTGEEDEAVLFSERSKLFRFVPESKEWKERGLGDFKILKNNVSGKVRFLMRREQVLKVCCNHILSKSMEFKPLATSDRAWTWTAGDFSEGEVSNELFALKFKTTEMAKNWKKVVDDCQTGITDSPAEAAPTSTTLEDKVKTAKPTGTTLAQFAAAQKQSSWECEGCLTRNDNSKIQCLACEGPKPGCEEEVKKLQEAAKPPAPVMTIGAGGGFKFGGSTTPAAPSGSGFNFSSTVAVTTTAATGFSFGTPTTSSASSGFSFGSVSSSTTATTNGGFSMNKVEEVKEVAKSPFGTADSHQFSFSGVKTSPVKPGSVSPRKHNESTTSENELYQEEDNDNLYFEPVIPLPDKVEVKTGEEDELVLYSHRAKLFRYLDGEWKERGVGDIKILKNEGVGKVRLLMRRDQVLKICLNHYLTPQLVSQFKEKDTKSWTWAAQDFSEGELESMTFALRFKSPEISSDFKQAIDDAVKNLSSVSPVKNEKSVSKKSPEKSKSKTPDNISKSPEKELFTPAQFKPAEDIANEVELSFEGQGLKLNTAEDAADVAAKISNHGPMHVLTFSANTVGIDAAGAIGKALEKHSEFRRAHWKDMFTGRMKTEIPPALVNLTRGIMTAQARLVELDLSDNAFGPVGMEGLITFLKSPSCFSLQELKLNNTGCGVTGGKMLANLLLDCYNRSKAIGHPLALKVFILGRSRQENEGATALAQVFKLMGSLEEVVMPQNGIYHEGLSALADAFASNPNLKILNMNDNTFTAKGAKAMGAAIKKLNNLEVLNLGDCLLKSGGTKLICKALKGRHPKLREFVLDSNEIRARGGLEIVEAVKGKENLVKLSIDGNQFGEDGLKKILQKLEEIGKKSIIGEVEDTEEPDSDEEDPEVSDDEDDSSPAPAAAPKPAFSFNAEAVQAPSSIFGGSPKTTTSVFGGSASTPTIFGGASANTPFKPAGSLFGSAESPGGSIFGKAAESSASVFGKPAESSNLFGKPANSSGTPVFGKPASDSPSSNLFGKPAESPSIFGKAATETPKSTFGAAVFVGASNSPSIFGGSNTTPTSGTGLFGKPAEGQADSTTSSSSVFGSGSKSTGFDFTSLAENSGPGFNTAGEGFKFAGSGSSLFGKSAKDGDNEDDDDDAEDDGHDPHFEPIVPLPELVETKTGEEDEFVVFKHRAKVYRYCGDTKQWKERGVGDIKILKHSTSGVTRVLLRRDQVHKIAANHRITKDMELKPLASSETAWCWYAMDFSEGHEENGSLEHLAVRFKNKDTAEDFKAKFGQCQEEIGQVVTETVRVPEANVSEETTEQGDEDYEGYEDEEDYDENGETIMFHQTATLLIKNDGTGEFMNQGEVDLRIVYDDDVYGARILAEGPTAGSEDDNTVCNHLIAMQTVLSDDPDLEWSALDFSTDPPSYRTFRVEFGSEDLKSEFKDMFSEGKELAEQSEILETVGDQDPAQFYYGQGADTEA
eukprot:GFUD01040043.1.p1 GENE.GFUD01040043.1~~GFUD01040043.1.p1  ORF type:complete len:2751 (-),score=928.30 GFUD01040043.1:212-8194(-)